MCDLASPGGEGAGGGGGGGGHGRSGRSETTLFLLLLLSNPALTRQVDFKLRFLYTFDFLGAGLFSNDFPRCRSIF